MANELAVINGNQKASPVLFKQFLDSRKEEMVAYATSEISTDRFMRLALNCVSNNPKLQDCTLISVYKAAMEVYELGLQLSGTGGEAYLVAYKDSCSFQLGYKGDIALLRRSGYIDDVWAKPVYKDDLFELEFGTNPFIKHVPDYDEGGKESKFRGAYCVIKLKGVVTPHIEYMSKVEIDEIRKKRRNARPDDTWATNYVRMAVKTVIKRAATQMDIRGKAADAFNRDSEADGFDYSNSSETTTSTTSVGGNAAVLAKIKAQEAAQAAAATENAQTPDNGVVNTEFKQESKTEEELAAEADAEMALAESRDIMLASVIKVKPEGEEPKEYFQRILGRKSPVSPKSWTFEDLAVIGNYMLANQPKAEEVKPEEDPDYISCTLHDEFMAASGNAEKFAVLFPKKSKEVDLLLAFRLLDIPDTEKVKAWIETQKG